MKRRMWLGLCLSAFVSGCLGLTAPEKEIAWIRLKNNSDEARVVEIFIERNGEEVFRETYQLDSSPEETTVQVDKPVEDPGRYSIYFDIGNQLVHLHPSEFAEADINESCIGIRYTLHEQGTTGFEFKPAQRCSSVA